MHQHCKSTEKSTYQFYWLEPVAEEIVEFEEGGKANQITESQGLGSTDPRSCSHLAVKFH